jgi:hypothetical protein
MARTADRLSALLQSIIPSTVRRAEWRLLAAGPELLEPDLRVLLDFHQDVLCPLSSTFAFAIPCGAALRAIARHAPHGVVEIGAGNGLWAALLRSQGDIRVHASDSSTAPVPFTRVGCSDAADAAARAPSTSALLLCWPALELELGAFSSRVGAAPSDEEDEEATNMMALEALRAFRGRTLIYVGEWRGRSGLVSQLSWRTAECGQTAGRAFQCEVESEWQLVESVSLPRWPGFSDALYVFRRAGPGDAQDVSHCTETQELWARAAEGQGVDSTHQRLRAIIAAGLHQPAALAAAILLERDDREEIASGPASLAR